MKPRIVVGVNQDAKPDGSHPIPAQLHVLMVSTPIQSDLGIHDMDVPRTSQGELMLFTFNKMTEKDRR